MHTPNTPLHDHAAALDTAGDAGIADATPEHGPTPEAGRCRNCAAPLLGKHCYACGQPVNGLVRHFRSIVGDLLGSVFDLDSRMLRTLGPLLSRPGFLSNQYFEGHRIRYVSPVRLFVFLCIVAFFTLRFVVDTGFVTDDGDAMADATTVQQVEQLRDDALSELRKVQGQLDHPAARGAIDAQLRVIEQQAAARLARLAARDAAIARGELPQPEVRVENDSGVRFDFNGEPWHPTDNPVRFESLPEGFSRWVNGLLSRADANVERVRKNPELMVETVLQTLPTTFFVLLPLFALLLKIAYLFERRLYMEHLIVALHSHAFLCLALLLMVGIDTLASLAGGLAGGLLGWLEVALALWMPLYILLQQKRVYRQGWIMTLLKFVLLGVAYTFLLSLGVVANLMLSLVTL